VKAAIRTYLIIILGLIAFVDIQMIAEPIRDKRLHGVVLATKKPPLILSSLADGSFQSIFDRWVSENTGFKGYMVRLENQMNYWIFRELSTKYATRITLCRKNQLFEKAYIDSYNRLDIVDSGRLEEKVMSIGHLQKLLNSHNIQFLFVITPSKAVIHPEFIQDRYLMNRRLGLKSNYENILPLLKRHRIEYLDGHKLFMDLKDKSEYDLFPNTGIHWNFYSSYLFTSEMIRRLRINSGLNIPEIVCEKITIQPFPVSPDDDILKLSNLMYPKRLYMRYPYPTTVAEARENNYLPSILFEGGSFINSLIYFIVRHRCYREIEYLFYYNEIHRFRRNDNYELSRERIYSGERNGLAKLGIRISIFKKTRSNLRDTILSKDIVILEANEQALSNIGSGFVEDAIAALEEDHDR